MQHVDALAVLQVLCGLWFLPHCIGKMRNVDAAANNTFLKAGFPQPRLFVLLTIALELLACAGLVFAIFPKAAALLAAGVLAGAALAMLRINGWQWRWQKQGAEYMVFWAAVCLVSAWGR